MTKSKLIPSLSYVELLRTIRHEIEEGKRIIRETQAEKYWRIGHFISDYILNGEDRAQYGEHLLGTLAKDLRLSVDTLERAVRFSRHFPISAARRKLPWTHFRALLSLPDPSERRKFADKARRENLSSRALQTEIKKRKVIVPTDGPIPQLKVTRGKLYTYRIVEPDVYHPTVESKFVDCGFDVYKEIPLAQLASFEHDEIIETHKEEGRYRIRSTKRTAQDLYLFKAYVEKIIDADTIKADVDLGFGIYKNHKLRFRGIDTPELTIPAGQEAKQFVEEKLKSCRFVILKTYKDDKYGRYLVDVFYLPGEQDAAKVAAQGIFLNQELLNLRLAAKW